MAKSTLEQKQTKSKNKPQHYQAKTKQQQTEWTKLVNFLKKKELLPVVVFVFSKKRCEDLGYGLGQTDLCSKEEKHQIHSFMEDSFNRLKGTDRGLPQVVRIKELLKRGIGVHHGGLLPIVKEVVEILFSRGLVKVLFATETFAMGVNMPARTVVFNSIQKHDGRSFRDLISNEYIQMSGRAGRRGLDSTGMVIIAAFTEVPEASVLSTMILGKATKLESQFRLTYNMILNLLRVQDFKVEDMMKRSFSEVASQRLVPEQQEILSRGIEKLQKIGDIECIMGEPDIENYHQITSEINSMSSYLSKSIISSPKGSAALTAGRVILIDNQVTSYLRNQNLTFFATH